MFGSLRDLARGKRSDAKKPTNDATSHGNIWSQKSDLAALNEAPPAYTMEVSPATPASPAVPAPLQYQLNQTGPPATALLNPIADSSPESPYAFLATFDTVLLVDDSGSMRGDRWKETSQALAVLAPIVTTFDTDGIDVYFLNHSSNDPGHPEQGVAAGSYRSINQAGRVGEIFQRIVPRGGTPTGIRLHHILRPYLARLEKEMGSAHVAAGKPLTLKPLNIIVITDGSASDDPETVLLDTAQKLDRWNAPPFQIGVQFFQVGDDSDARERLRELDDDLGKMVGEGVRDIVDTVTWQGGNSANAGGVGLTGDGILKAVLGAVNKRLDRKRASGEISRGRAS